MSASGGNPYGDLIGLAARADTDEGNPYLAAAPALAAADLDAQAPMLRASEPQRLNRRALAFLAGIVGLLALMAIWLFARATGDDAREAVRTDGEVVRIPELPKSAATSAVAAAPIDVEPAGGFGDEPADLPPLPPAAPPTYYPPGSPPPAYPASRSAASAPPPSLLDRRMGAETGPAVSTEQAYAQAMLASLQAAAPKTAEATPGPSRAGGARVLPNPDTLLLRGTYIRCVLETRIVTDLPGFTACVVTEPVYSVNGRSLLLPKGSKMVGRYQDEPNGPRIAVVWDRITTPNGLDVNMASPGVDGLGGAGHPGHYDAHWPSRITSALLISLVSDGFKYAAAEHGPRMTISTGTNVVEMPFESNTARTMERLANQALAQSGRRPATVTINHGSVVNVYVARDIDFSGVVAAR